MARRPDTSSWRDRVTVLGPAIVVTPTGFLVACQLVDPAPPKKITPATGGTDRAYYLYGRRYKALLQRHGAELEVRVAGASLHPAPVDLLLQAADEVYG